MAFQVSPRDIPPYVYILQIISLYGKVNHYLSISLLMGIQIIFNFSNFFLLCKMLQSVSICIHVDSVQFSHSVISDSLRPHESQHTRPLLRIINSKYIELMYVLSLGSRQIGMIMMVAIGDSLRGTKAKRGNKTSAFEAYLRHQMTRVETLRQLSLMYPGLIIRAVVC